MPSSLPLHSQLNLAMHFFKCRNYTSSLVQQACDMADIAIVCLGTGNLRIHAHFMKSIFSVMVYAKSSPDLAEPLILDHQSLC
jgi:hypothetical protein